MLRLKIKGNWEPEDFIEVLQATESLYYKALGHRHRQDFSDILFYEREMPFSSNDYRLNYLNDWMLKETRMTADENERLQVSRIEYASPGGIDLIGIGKALEFVDKIIGRLIDFYTERHIRGERNKQETIKTARMAVELEKEQEELKALQIRNAKELLKLRYQYRGELDEILLLLAVRDQEKLATRISEGKLIGVTRPIDEKK